MLEIELDGQKVAVAEGCMVMHAAEKAGTYIPHFCYHEKLSIAANCRMCLVDVEKEPKPMPACPICDQGGECQLQDLAVGYGGSAARYAEEKRVVPHKDVGPLISMEEMSR